MDELGILLLVSGGKIITGLSGWITHNDKLDPAAIIVLTPNAQEACSNSVAFFYFSN